MPTKAINIYKPFEIKVDCLNNYRIKYDSLVVNNTLNEPEVEQAYAGLFLNLFTEFEGLLENLFWGLLKGKVISSHTDYKRLVKISPNNSVEIIVLGEKRNYLDWLPLQDYTFPRVKRFFYEGIPFTDVSDSHKSNLKFYHTIRNSLAHKSDYSITKFQQAISGLTLLPKEKQPSGFLRSIPNRVLNKTQYEIASDELKVIAKIICK